MFRRDFSRQRFYGVEVCASGHNLDRGGIACAHCGRHEWVNGGGTDAIGARCTCCDKFICLNCVGKGCMPLEERLDAWERYNNGHRYLRKDRIFEIFQDFGGKILR